jgi:hypothetical protein
MEEKRKATVKFLSRSGPGRLHGLERWPFYHPEDPTERYKEAAFTYFRCRRTGVTIHSAADRLIARVTIEQDLVLPQDDQTFQNMACVVPDLTPASAGFYLSAPSGVKCRYEAR